MLTKINITKKAFLLNYSLILFFDVIAILGSEITIMFQNISIYKNGSV